MKFITTDKDGVLIGSGYLYACNAKDFDGTNYDLEEMDELGYIKENAVFAREPEAKTITSANYGDVTNFISKYNTTFETGIFSYNPEKIKKFSGNKVVTADESDARKKTTYMGEKDQRPAVALVFVGEDEDTGEEFRLVMPKAQWTSAFELDFNNDDPVTLNYTFGLNNVRMPNGDIGAAWIEQITHFIYTAVATSATFDEDETYYTRSGSEGSYTYTVADIDAFAVGTTYYTRNI